MTLASYLKVSVSNHSQDICRTIGAPVSRLQPFPSASLPVHCSLIVLYNLKHYKRNEITKSRNIFLGKVILRHVWFKGSRDGSAGINIRPRNRPSVFVRLPARQESFSSSETSRPALESSKPGREIHHSPPSPVRTSGPAPLRHLYAVCSDDGQPYVFRHCVTQCVACNPHFTGPVPCKQGEE